MLSLLKELCVLDKGMGHTLHPDVISLFPAMYTYNGWCGMKHVCTKQLYLECCTPHLAFYTPMKGVNYF